MARKPITTYKGNDFIKAAGVQLEWTDEQLDEWMRCADDPIYWAENYLHVVNVDKGLQLVELYDYQKEMIQSSVDNRFTAVVTARQAGKALALDTPIPKPDGTWTTIGELSVNQSIIGANGHPTTVTGKSEIHYKPTYAIKFDYADDVTVACEDHLWSVFDLAYTDVRTVSTKEIADAPDRYYFPLAAPIEYNTPSEREDCFSAGVISLNVPDDVLYGAIRQRRAYLRGIVASHAIVSPDNVATVVPANDEQARQIVQLASSLSYGAFVDDDGIVMIDFDAQYRTIEFIEQIDTEPTQCITVDAPDHCFVYGHEYIVTHNTTAAVAIILHAMLFSEYEYIALTANKERTARRILKRIQTSYKNLPFWMQQGVEEWNKGSVTLETGTEVVAAATSSDAIRGDSVTFLYIDEIAYVDNWDEFSASVLPTISSGNSTRVFYTSTPNGLNHFYQIIQNGLKGKNGFNVIEAPWWRVPGRDEEWRKQALATLDYDEQTFAQEYECVTGDTIVRVRDKDTLQEFDITIKELYKWMEFEK